MGQDKKIMEKKYQKVTLTINLDASFHCYFSHTLRVQLLFTFKKDQRLNY